jgi:hypothetical protein
MAECVFYDCWAFCGDSFLLSSFDLECYLILDLPNDFLSERPIIESEVFLCWWWGLSVLLCPVVFAL